MAEPALLKAKVIVLKGLLAQLRKEYDESKHPRDERGRWSEAQRAREAVFTAHMRSNRKTLIGLRDRYQAEAVIAEAVGADPSSQKELHRLYSSLVAQWSASTAAEAEQHNRLLRRQGTQTIKEWFTEHEGTGIAPGHLRPFTEAESAALQAYVIDSTVSNDLLRTYKGNQYFIRATKNNRHWYDTMIAEMDSAFHKVPPLEQPVVLYRGLDGEFTRKLNSMKEGSAYTDHGYTSTSVSKGQAKVFADRGSAKMLAKGEVAEIHVPRFRKVVFIPGLQREAVLPRGTRFGIVKTIAQGAARFILKVL